MERSGQRSKTSCYISTTPNDVNSLLIQQLSLNPAPALGRQIMCSTCFVEVDECSNIVVTFGCQHWVCLECFDKHAAYYKNLVHVPSVPLCVYPGCLSASSLPPSNYQIVLNCNEPLFQERFSLIHTGFNVHPQEGEYRYSASTLAPERMDALAQKGRTLF